MQSLALAILVGSAVLITYAVLGYPAFLWVLARFRSRRPRNSGSPPRSVSVSLPAYNEAATIRETLEHILSAECPVERQILVVSDASTDETEDIVREFAGRGVELLRVDERTGKTAAENAALPHLRGAVIINTDASVRIHQQAIVKLLDAFADPEVGLASGRDVSMSHDADTANPGEARYVGYEMKVRALETEVDSIVGASGSLYAIRADLHRALVPEALSRDFAAALIAREHRLRAVSVWDAICFVPRVTSLRREYNRKVRTVTRGMETLYYKRHLLNPLRHGQFAWMLFSHKVCRWVMPWAVLGGALAAVWIGTNLWGWPILAGAVAGVAATAVLLKMALAGRNLPRFLQVAAFSIAGNVAVGHAWLRALRGELDPVWEPTRRNPQEIS